MLRVDFLVMMRPFAAALIAALPDRRLAAGRLTGMAYALKHEAMRQRVRKITARTNDAGAAGLRTAVEARALPMPADVFVRVLHALIEGLSAKGREEADSRAADVSAEAIGNWILN